MTEIALILSVILNIIFALFIILNFYTKKKKTYKDKELQLEKLHRDFSVYRNRVNLLNLWMEKRNQNRSISIYLNKNNIINIGIYGLGTLGERLLEEILTDPNITVSFILDKKWVLQGGRYKGIPVISPDLLNKYPETQWLIVTPIFDIYSIRTELFEINPQIEIKGIDEIINRM